MANPAQMVEGSEPETNQEQENVGVYTAKVSRTIKKADGTEVKKEATISVPKATTMEMAYAQQGGKTEDVLYWYDLARQLMARQQVFAALGNTYADEKVNELNDQFESALKSMLAGSKDPKKIEKYRNYILSEEQFQPLVEAQKALDESSKPHFDFSVLEIKRPGGKPGPKPKEESK